jgi:hypothetical protein
MTKNQFRQILSTLAAVALAAVTAHGQKQTPGPTPQKPDHMQHRFDDPERLAKSFDEVGGQPDRRGRAGWR